MSVNDITDEQVVRACLEGYRDDRFANQVLAERTGQPIKVCDRAMERAFRRGFIEYGVSLRTAWATLEGKELIR